MLARFTCIFLALALLQISSVEPAGKYDPRGAYISLHAKWNSTPLLHEAAEFLVCVDWSLSHMHQYSSVAG